MPGFSITDILSPIKSSTPRKVDNVDVCSDPLAELSALLHDVQGAFPDSGFSELSSFGSPAAVTPAPVSLMPAPVLPAVINTPSVTPVSSTPCPDALTSSLSSASVASDVLTPGAHLYNHLQRSLSQESCSPPWTLFASSPMAAPLQSNSLTSRECLLQMTFQDAHLNASFPHHTRDLRLAYDNEVRRLTRERQSALESSASLPWLEQPISSYYLLQHIALIERIERSLALLRSTMMMPPTSLSQVTFSTSTPKRTVPTGRATRRTLNDRAVRIMEKWYLEHEEHPYPSYESCEVMGEAGDITVEQVKKWFANRRLRKNNTKSLKEIARRRKVTRSKVDVVNTAWWMAAQV